MDKQTAKLIARIAENLPDMKSDVMQRWSNDDKNLQMALKMAFCQPATVSNLLFRRISDGASLFFSACDGSETIADAHDVFKSGIGGEDLSGLSGHSKATRKTHAEVYKLLKNATLKEMFTFLSPSDLGVLCLTGHQIKTFCKEHRAWLCAAGYGMFFLTKKNWKAPATFDNLFVARVRVDSAVLSVYVCPFESCLMWYANDHFRLAVPQLVD